MINYNNLSDKILVKKVQREENNDALKELITRHTPICYHVFQRYSGVIQEKGGSVKDLYDDKDYIIYNSAKNYDPNRGCKFSSHLRNMARFMCLNFINKETKHIHHVSLDEIDEVSEKTTDSCKFLSDRALKDVVLKHLDELEDKRIKKIFEIRYFSGDKKTWKEVGDKIGFCYETARCLHKNNLGYLKEKILINKQKDLFFG